MQLELTVGGEGQGLGERWEKLYKRWPDLPALVSLAEHDKANKQTYWCGRRGWMVAGLWILSMQ